MTEKALIVGGGIGGLAAALACARVGLEVDLFERAAEFSEVGAGIQLGPNVTAVLHAWGLQDALASVAAFPARLQVRSASSGCELGTLTLGAAAQARYGFPYATIHRADLHTLLYRALQRQTGVRLYAGSTAAGFVQREQDVRLQLADGRAAQGDLLVGADGLWSAVREQLLHDGKPIATGHLAYRALVPQSSLPERLRSQQVTVWLGPRLHVVQYPVRSGDWLNVVAIVQGRTVGDAEHWDHSANAGELQRHLAATCTSLQDLIHAIERWRLWPLSIRAPMRGAHEQAQGRVALLGDAAHPMLPYLAQGAGMAIEDAAALGRVLTRVGTTQAMLPARDLPDLLTQYAQRRWQRNARVQARAIRNGEIFHATGPLRWGRDAAMKLLGERLLDLPWLYGASQ
ncbi:MAG: FAD-dependent monooxygenase [Gammaproteobacteria bacterium]|uniref:FAD-dependent monooxygenase n=1 Tax=Rhodoferax sp. TaxID=50421 RepID=UPI0018001953|nr:FAD-dependent monooxygenase [Rhodoferax sp.]MBU3898074.1 FAD-dependent monooxygenase [Gammaproteobacteria bacterium]MBA3056390.1 FAD-dependent oxidoreductase [Rhodoferax sp.]MBU3999169.1 FAD-dependent monooxygenase [Gammaproteobacteria bacterium]MBU4081732.1 FAD-dependent monooxygenase [Gammaproteobacteria bacterium]MBU4114612.1 FAD-dependent monooxygenase [Gammaproteobacteria bacterium]